MKKSFIVSMESEPDARMIAQLVQTANIYASRIYLETEGKCVNVKSIMGMMSFALVNKMPVVLSAEGADEEMAVAALEKFLIV